MESTNLENRKMAKEKALEAFLSMSIAVTGRDVKAPKSYKDKVIADAGLTDNPDFQAVDAFFSNIEDDRLIFSIINVIMMIHLRPTQLLKLNTAKITTALIEAIEEDDPYGEKRKKPSPEVLKSRMDEILGRIDE